MSSSSSSVRLRRKEGRKEGKADVERLKVVWFVGLGGQWDKEKMVIRPILLFDGPSFKG